MTGREKVTYRETERTNPTDESRQGDIIRIEYSDGSHSGPSLGVIINADCDLMHNKTDGVIAYLPVYTFREYLSEFWAPVFLQTVQNASTLKIVEVANDDENVAATLHDWIRSTPVEDVIRGLGSLCNTKKSNASHFDEHVRRLAITLNSVQTPIERFSNLCRAGKDPEGYARKHISAAKKDLGDGNFFISDLVDHDEVGFVIRMRRIYTIPERLYFPSIAAQRAHSGIDNTTAVRVARLTSLYRFKVLQLFAQQYSRIGLPDDVTALGDLAIEHLVSQLSQVIP